MVGAKIPVLEIEKLTLSKDGRGLYAYNDGDVIFGGSLTGKSGSAANESRKFIPAASANAFLKITYTSGTSATETTGYIPIINTLW